jgi:hypothetical protein
MALQVPLPIFKTLSYQDVSRGHHIFLNYFSKIINMKHATSSKISRPRELRDPKLNGA